MKKRDDLVPLKVVLDEVCVSRNTLWRASRSAIAGFPAPVVIRRLVYWRKADLPRLEEALLRYQGRCAFERRRDHAKKVGTLSKLRGMSGKRPRRKSENHRADPAQQDLF